jgi:GT2 family glycosyltransferase/glycosyltransferase involved in cell wall biosynthesis
MSVEEVKKWDLFYESFDLPPDGAEDGSIYREIVDYFKKLPQLSPCARTLEAGCGSGLHSLALAKSGFQTSLLDFSKEAITTSKKVFSRAGLTADFHLGDVYKDDDLLGYDVAFNSGVLEHYSFDEQVRFVEALAKRSNKYVLILVPNRECYWYWVWRIYKQSNNQWPFGYEKPTTNYSEVFSQAGIDLVEKTFYGVNWTDDFVRGIGLPSELSSLITQIHSSKIVDISTRSYLVGFLGVKRFPGQEGKDKSKVPLLSVPHITRTDYGDQVVALAADALATMIHNRSNARIDSNREILELTKSVANRDAQIVDLNHNLADRDAQIVDISYNLADRDAQIVDISYNVADRDAQIVDLNHKVADRDAQVVSLTQAVAGRNRQIEDLQSIRAIERHETVRLSDWAQAMNERPLRYGIKKHLRGAAMAFYHALPFDLAVKQRLKSRVRRFVQPSTGSDNKVVTPSCDCGPETGQPIPHEVRVFETMSPCLLALATGGNLKERDLFVFSVIDWHFRIQRPQHIARSFAKTGKRVFFFSNHFVDAAKPGYELDRLDPMLELYQVKLHVKGAPAIYFAPPTNEAMAMIQDGIAQLMLDFAAVSSISLVQHAYWYPVVTRLPNTLRLYDCMDHHEGFGNVPEKLIAIEKNMLRGSDLVVTTSTWLEEFAQGYNSNVALVRNAGEYEHFSEPPVEVYQDPLGRKIVGYYGAIAEWFDLDLIRAVAESNPQAVVLLVGNDTVDAKKKLKKIPNVEFTGEVPYTRLPYYLYAFDVCLLPFQVIPLTLATNPVKVYEYLAAGIPIVSVDLPEISQFGDLIHCAPNHDEFVRMVSDCLTQTQSEEAGQQRRQFACTQTWDHRVEVLGQSIQGLSLPRISVIVLTYNNLDLTKDCLDSLVRWSDYPNLELIIVDNASSDGSPDYLRQFESQHPQVKVLLNSENLGFAAGNNVGLKAATGDYLVMLNNDTIVTPGWALTLLRYLQADEQIGLIGPVTNNIGNEAKININYDTPTEMLPQAMSYTTRHMGQTIPLRTAAFFCVMLSRKVFEQAGLLDEDFGRGFFEDDDYCRRAEQLGLRIVCAEDVFIHHHLSASFDKLKSKERQKLFEQNKVVYEEKWGEWVPHHYR